MISVWFVTTSETKTMSPLSYCGHWCKLLTSCLTLHTNSALLVEGNIGLIFKVNISKFWSSSILNWNFSKLSANNHCMVSVQYSTLSFSTNQFIVRPDVAVIRQRKSIKAIRVFYANVVGWRYPRTKSEVQTSVGVKRRQEHGVISLRFATSGSNKALTRIIARISQFT